VVLASAIKQDPGGNKIPLPAGEGDEPAWPIEPPRALRNYLMPSPRLRHPIGFRLPHIRPGKE
jgi:hypothetical protein